MSEASFSLRFLVDGHLGRRDRPHTQSLQTRCVSFPIPYNIMPWCLFANHDFCSYAVLDLQPGVPESEIKVCYRKKSLLIHPDKTSNPRAPDAFDRLKKAQTELLDEKQRTTLDECIADARMLLMRERKLSVDSDEVKNPDKEFKEAWRRKTVEVLVDNEQRRRKQIKAQMQEEGREQRRVDEEIESRKRRRDHEVQWEQTREGRIGSWRDFQQKTKEEPGKKKKKMKVLG